MSKTLAWGILSTATVNEALIVALRAAPRSELVAVASRRHDQVHAYAARRGIPIAYSSYAELLADPQIDVVYIPLPNTLHSQWAVRAACAGKHVLVEKPIATTCAELDAIEAAAQSNHVTIFEGLMSLHSPQTLKLKEMIEQGWLGTLQFLHSWFSYELPDDSPNIRLDPALAGGSLWDVGVYSNSLLITMAGGRAPVQVWATQTIGKTGVEVELAAQMRFANGVMAQSYSGFRTPFFQGAQFVGTEGILKVPSTVIPGMQSRTEAGSASSIYFTPPDGREQMITIPQANPWQTEVEALEACVLDGAPPVVPLSQSREFLKTALAMYESANSGRVVSVHESPAWQNLAAWSAPLYP